MSRDGGKRWEDAARDFRSREPRHLVDSRWLVSPQIETTDLGWHILERPWERAPQSLFGRLCVLESEPTRVGSNWRSHSTEIIQLISICVSRDGPRAKRRVSGVRSPELRRRILLIL